MRREGWGIHRGLYIRGGMSKCMTGRGRVVNQQCYTVHSYSSPLCLGRGFTIYNNYYIKLGRLSSELGKMWGNVHCIGPRHLGNYYITTVHVQDKQRIHTASHDMVKSVWWPCSVTYMGSCFQP